MHDFLPDVDPPRRLGEMTTAELARHERELNDALDAVPYGSQVWRAARKRLDDVHEENRSRRSIAQANGR